MSDYCTENDAKEAAVLLDNNQISQASQKLFDCAFSATNLTVDYQKVRNFVEKVADNETPQKGADLKLQYSIGRLQGHILSGFEIER